DGGKSDGLCSLRTGRQRAQRQAREARSGMRVVVAADDQPALRRLADGFAERSWMSRIQGQVGNSCSQTAQRGNDPVDTRRKVDCNGLLGCSRHARAQGYRQLRGLLIQLLEGKTAIVVAHRQL